MLLTETKEQNLHGIDAGNSPTTTELYFWKIYKNTYITMDQIAHVILDCLSRLFYFIILHRVILKYI